MAKAADDLKRTSHDQFHILGVQVKTTSATKIS